MRFLLDTNVLIPLEDSQVGLSPSLSLFVRLANDHGHPLVYHPSSELDINKDRNPSRRRQTLERLHQYIRLDHLPVCPWNNEQTDPNDAIDNEILHAIAIHAARFLVTEDLGIHRKARVQGLGDRILTIQMAADLLRRLHERIQVQLPNISEIPLHAVVQQLPGSFFNSLRESYPGFDDWFREKAEDGRNAWACQEPSGGLRGLCIFAIQTDERITDDGVILFGHALKLCTFKVAEEERGQKIGELFLKAAFRYATRNKLGSIFITADAQRQQRLIDLLGDFGFECAGKHGCDKVYVKRHPIVAPAPEGDPVAYNRAFFPHYMDGKDIQKFIIPVVPRFHQVLFPDYHREGDPRPLFEIPQTIAAGNAIKLAYLCHGSSNQIHSGDVVLFYRSGDYKAVTSLGVVEQFETLADAEAIIGLVRRRTVYSMDEILEMADRPTKVMLFRLVEHLPRYVSYPRLLRDKILNGRPRSITRISHESYLKLREASLV